MRLVLALIVPLVLRAEPNDLFNGRDLAGWVHEGPRATFSAVQGELYSSGAGNVPNWLRTAAEYDNFRLEFEYKLSQWTEAAVYLRAPRVGRPARAGIAISLGHHRRFAGAAAAQGVPGRLAQGPRRTGRRPLEGRD